MSPGLQPDAANYGTTSLSQLESKSHYLPKSGFDTHVHVFDPSLGPYATGRAYTPEDAPLEKLIAFHQSISIDAKVGKVVLVQPSPYKTDCTVLMKCLRELQRRGISAYAIVVIDVENVTDEELEDMHQLGTRGIRLNFQADGKDVDLPRLVTLLRRAADRIRDLPGWMIQLYVPVWVWDALYDPILALPVNIIADHLGGTLGASKLPPELQSVPLSQPGFSSLLSLAKREKVLVKISGLYRGSKDVVSNFSDMQPIIETLAREIPDQVVWGSDWPHTGDAANRVSNTDLSIKEPFRTIDNLGILRNLQNWVDSEEVWRKLLKDNPERFYR